MTDTYSGEVYGNHPTFNQLTSKDTFRAKIQFACWTKNPFTRILGAEGFGVEALQNLDTFRNAKPTGRMIRFDSGVYQVGGTIFDTSATAFHTGRMDRFNPALVEDGDEWAYAWHQMNVVEFIPEMDVEDNVKGFIKRTTLREQAMKNQMVTDFNYNILGNSSGADYGTKGPNSVYSDLPNLISVTQTRTVGAIAATNSFWQNQYKAATSIGGGGELDRPLVLRRSLMDVFNDTLQLAESTGPQDYLLLGTQGAHQYYDRLMYADANRAGGDFGRSGRYDAAGVQTFAFNGAPLIWDPAVTVPYGATAATECIYGIHMPSFAVGIRSEKNFHFTGWEKSREHDDYKTYIARCTVRYTPMVTARRPHFVLYNMPACPD